MDAAINARLAGKTRSNDAGPCRAPPSTHWNGRSFRMRSGTARRSAHRGRAPSPGTSPRDASGPAPGRGRAVSASKPANGRRHPPRGCYGRTSTRSWARARRRRGTRPGRRSRHGQAKRPAPVAAGKSCRRATARGRRSLPCYLLLQEGLDESGKW